MTGSARTVIIDTDPGIDDLVTLALAASDPSLDVLCVVTSYGNCTLDHATSNARAVLELTGRAEIPVVPGAAAPLKRELETAPETHGPEGRGYAAGPPPVAVVENRTALLDELRRAEKPVHLITLGPLTNLAHALRTDEMTVRDRMAGHIGMFGNLYERGNTNRWADFNAWCDPEALELVLRSGLGSRMVGLDVTRRIILSSDEVARAAGSNNELQQWLGDALRWYVEFHRGREGLDGCVVNDVLTVAELLSPGVLQFEKLPLKVNLGAGQHRGRTERREGGVETEVALGVNVSRAKSLLRRIL